MRIFNLLLLLVSGVAASAAESWPAALTGMPLAGNPNVLNHSNCAQVVFGAFQSNATVKALIFMPGATDELYFFRRVNVELTNTSPTLFDAISALTNQSPLRVAFRDPFLLIYSEEDLLELNIEIKHPATAEKLKAGKPLSHLVFLDSDWDKMLGVIQPSIKASLEPWTKTRASWHFYRHTFAGWNLTPWETLEAAAFAGKTQFRVNRHSVRFELDPRFGSLPKLEQFPPKR